MNHSFTPSALDVTKCGICKYNVMAHTDMATCECCPNIGPCEIYMTMLMCQECIKKNEMLNAKSASEAEQRVQSVIDRARTIDYSIRVREDIFNAQTVSFTELKSAIYSDGTITNKPYELAKLVKERIEHFQKVIFDKQSEIAEEHNKQRFWQEQANQLASQLRVEEREKLKLQDISYKPTENKPRVAKVTTKKGFDKAELVKYANSVDIPLAAFQMVCVAKNMTPEQAAEHFKKIKANSN